MKTLFAVLLLLSATLANAAGDSWVAFDAGMAKAKEEDKPIIIDFYTDWCHWCKVMDEKTFNDKTVKAELEKKFVTIRLNAEDRNATATYDGKTFNNVELTQAFGVTGYPTLAFLESDGTVITTLPGFVQPEQFLPILSYIEQKMYAKQMPFEEFLKKYEQEK
jgi:thioredoxin-related protein